MAAIAAAGEMLAVPASVQMTSAPLLKWLCGAEMKRKHAAAKQMKAYEKALQKKMPAISGKICNAQYSENISNLSAIM